MCAAAAEYPNPEAAMAQDEELLVRATDRTELERIYRMERGEAREFIMAYSLDRHHAEFARPGVTYKSIWSEGHHVGFLILALDPDGRSVEFRRIVVIEPGRGFGRKAVRAVDAICRDELGRARVWLDVFEANQRARYLYEQCGYRRFGEYEREGRMLLLYEKAV